jgi:RNA polymerase sigma factor (sigma-70 family)
MFQQVLHALKHELTNDQRHVIVLRFLEEFSVRETAVIMRKTEEHVKVIQSRALAKMRRSMEYKELMKSLPSQRIRNVPEAVGI